MIYSWQEKKTIKFDSNYIFPRYDGLSFANIPGTILNLFGLKSPNPSIKTEIFQKIPKSKKIILLLLDGFGYLSWKKYFNDYSFFRMVSEKGDIFPLTSLFPSTTASCLTTLNSGLLPSEHGLPEWNVYFKEIDQVIQSLPLAPIGDRTPDALVKKGVDPKILFDKETIYDKLNAHNVQSFVFLREGISASAYNRVYLKKCHIISFQSLDDLLEKLVNTIKSEKNRAYFYIYWDEFDGAAHIYGPLSKEYKEELKSFSEGMMGLLQKSKREFCDSTLLITADHGEITTNPKDTIYLNDLPELVKNFAVSDHGRPILPSGNVRDVFLHVKEDSLDKMQLFLQEKLAGKAKVIKIKEAFELGLFGIKKPSRRFLDRIGNLLILPHLHVSIWYEHVPGKKYKHLANHGGLSRQEMLIPFGIVKLPPL